MTEEQVVHTLTNAVVIIGYCVICYSAGRMVAALMGSR